MSLAVAYNQSDIYRLLDEKITLVSTPLLHSLENFDFDACETSVDAIEKFHRECLHSVNFLAAIAHTFAEENKKIEDDLVEWLFELSKIIDSKIIGSPMFAKLDHDKRLMIESVATELAYDVSIIDLNNCRGIDDILAARGHLRND